MWVPSRNPVPVRMSAITTSANLSGMNGLYAFKPWYANRLARLQSVLVRRRVSPIVLTTLGVAFGAGAGAVLGFAGTGLIATAAVAALLALRLACANLDGGVARDGGRSTPFGAVANELGDRLAEFAALSGLVFVAPAWLVAVAALAGTMPSWVALAGAAAGAPRMQGGPVGKTERCLMLVIVAASGWYVPVLTALAAGSATTAVVRLMRIRRQLPVRSLADGMAAKDDVARLTLAVSR